MSLCLFVSLLIICLAAKKVHFTLKVLCTSSALALKWNFLLNMNKRLAELKNMLLSRDYKTKLIDNAIARAGAIPRSKALERVEKSNNGKRRPVLSVEYHPSLPALSSILKRHWRVMSQDPYLKEVFPLPPIVAYIRPANLKDKPIRARIPPDTSRPTRRLPGMKKCRFDCMTCPYVQ